MFEAALSSNEVVVVGAERRVQQYEFELLCL